MPKRSVTASQDFSDSYEVKEGSVSRPVQEVEFQTTTECPFTGLKELACGSKPETVADVIQILASNLQYECRKKKTAVETEVYRRLSAIEKSLQEAVKSRHISLNDKYIDVMDQIGCPWLQSLLPRSLACQDLAYYFAQVKDSLYTNRITTRVLEMIGYDDEYYLNDSADDGDDEDGEVRQAVEPMSLKRRGLSFRTAAQVHQQQQQQQPTEAEALQQQGLLTTGLRMVQMTLVMGLRVPLF